MTEPAASTRPKAKPYAELTPAEKRALCNGCGGKGGIFNPPEFIFGADCDRHDYSYAIGGTEDDRKRADDGFYRAMKEDASKAPFYKRPFYYALAFIYWRAVRRAGSRFFNYHDDPRND